MRLLHNPKEGNTKISGLLTTSEIEKAEMNWLKRTQQYAFKQELKLLQRGNMVYKDSLLYNLSPKLDENGLLLLQSRL